MSGSRVLVVDDKESVLELMKSILGPRHEVAVRSDAASAIALMRAERFDLVLTDVRMPGASGFEVLGAATRLAEPPVVVVMTGYASIPEAVSAIRQGAFDYVAKPLEADEVSLVVARALQHRTGAAEARGGEGGGGRDARGRGAGSPGATVDFREAMSAARDQASRGYLVTLMQQFRGNVTHAAKQAGMTRVSLHRLLKKYGVQSVAFKPEE
jgi:DNA-binding NtrC family response regulator